MITCRKREEKNGIPGKVLLDCVAGMWIPVLFTAAMEIADNALGVFMADTLGAFADAAFKLDFKEGMGSGGVLVLCMAATVFIVPLLEVMGSFSMLRRSLLHDNLVIGQYLAKEPEAAKAWESGELQYQLEDEPLTMRIWWVRIGSKALALPVCAAYLLYRAGSVDRLLTVMLLILAGIRQMVPVLFRNRLAAYDREEQMYLARRRSYEKDIMANCLSVRLLRIQKPMLERLGCLSEQYYEKSDANRIAWQTVADRSGEFADKLTQILLVTAGAVMVAMGRITPGGLAAMLVYFTVMQSLLNHLGEILQNWPLMMNAAAVVEKFYLDQETTAGTPIGHVESISGEEIGAAYSGREVFQGMDFSLLAGEKIGICGKNGSGKSTFGKILASLSRQYYGKINVNDMSYRTVNLEDWRRLIAYVPQEPWLSGTTVRENIMMGNFEADRERVERLLYDFGLFPIADKILSKDNRLSGGERRKVSVIRGLLKEAELLILDEPSNDLDPESVLLLKKYIGKTTQTVVLISHDKRLLEEMDRCINI